LSKKIIIHDNFEILGGAERSIIFLSKKYKLKIFTLYKNFKIEKNIFEKFYFINNNFFHPFLRFLVNFFFYYFYNFNFKKFKTVFLSGHYCLMLLKPNIKSKIIYICHSPPRFFGDLRKEYKNKYKIFYKLLFLNYFINLYAKIYYEKINYCNLIICNSIVTKKRLIKFVDKKKIKIIYPLSAEISKYRNDKDLSYFLSISRLHWNKRVLDVARLFCKDSLKNKKLVICSFGPEVNKLKNLIEENKHNNIKFLGEISEKKKIKLISRCSAVIHVPKNEEFGIINLETLASGKPLITTDEGYFGKILKNNKYNCVIKNFSPERLENAILNYKKKNYNSSSSIKANILFAKQLCYKNDKEDIIRKFCLD
jgi:glycosyltransferase involved in cell wall biosynthesis